MQVVWHIWFKENEVITKQPSLHLCIYLLSHLYFRLSEKALQIAEERREAKDKGEKERYTHLNAEFQRIARRDKKDFLCDQFKEIDENNRMGKIRDLFKKIRDTKAVFHAKMGSIKDRSGMAWTETEVIKKRWQQYTEELYKKIFMTQITRVVWTLP